MQLSTPFHLIARRLRARGEGGLARLVKVASPHSSTVSANQFGDFALSLVVSLACVLAFWALIGDVFRERWALDFRYFWTAGRLWLDGASAYGPAYLETGEAEFGSFPNPFFYPPNTLPVFAVFGAFEPKQAAAGFLALNMVLVGAYASFLSDIVNRMGFAARRSMVFALILPFTVLVYHPTLAAVVYGQPASILVAALTAFVYGAGSRRKWLAAIGLAGLLIKPQFSIGLIVLTLIRKELRPIAAPAIAITAAFTLAGLCVGDPMENIQRFLGNVSAYGGAHWNESEFSAGLGYLLGFASLHVSMATSLAGGIAASFLVSKLIGSDPVDVTRLFIASTLIICLSIIASPNHPNDFVLILTAIPLALCAPSPKTRLLAAAALVLLAGTIPTVLPLNGMTMDQKQSLIAAVHTLALFAIAGSSAAAAYSAKKMPVQA